MYDLKTIKKCKYVKNYKQNTNNGLKLVKIKIFS